MNVIQRMIRGMQKTLEIQLEINSWDILVMSTISLIFYLLAIALPVDSALVSDISVKGVLFFKFVLFAGSALLAWLSIAGYTEIYGEKLLINILFASGSMASMLLFAFWTIADAKGYYFLSPWAPVYLYFAAAVITAVLLHRYWTLPYLPRNIEEAARAAFNQNVVNCWLRDLTPCGEENRSAEPRAPSEVIVNNN